MGLQLDHTGNSKLKVGDNKFVLVFLFIDFGDSLL